MLSYIMHKAKHRHILSICLIKKQKKSIQRAMEIIGELTVSMII